jgi:hypothetical protein
MNTKGVIEFMQAIPLKFAAKKTARNISKAEADLFVNATISKYAAEHHLTYNAAFEAMQRDDPAAFASWAKIK